MCLICRTNAVQKARFVFARTTFDRLSENGLFIFIYLALIYSALQDDAFSAHFNDVLE